MAAVASSASSTLLANVTTPHIIENSDANRLHIKLGGAASTSDYTYSLAQYESVKIEGFYGAVYRIWAADGSGYAMVTELS